MVWFCRSSSVLVELLLCFLSSHILYFQNCTKQSKCDESKFIFNVLKKKPLWDSSSFLNFSSQSCFEKVQSLKRTRTSYLFPVDFRKTVVDSYTSRLLEAIFVSSEVIFFNMLPLTKWILLSIPRKLKQKLTVR